jgi:GNAT superfamily N-acetyltransferase
VDVDLQLVQRLEATAAIASLDLVKAIKVLAPASAAEGREFLGGALIAMGPGRYVNRAIGVSTCEMSADDVDTIEQFFAERGLPSMIELSSWAPPSTVAEFARRHYTPTWFRSVFALRPGSIAGPLRTDVRIDRVGDHNAAQWLEVFARGFEAEHGETRVANDEIGEAGRIAPNAHTFLAYLDDEAVGCGSMQVVDGVAWLGGAATVPAFRKRGVQAALVAYRLQLATELGCELAAVTALSSGPSARNIFRLGFPHTHTQVVVEKGVAMSS